MCDENEEYDDNVIEEEDQYYYDDNNEDDQEYYDDNDEDYQDYCDNGDPQDCYDDGYEDSVYDSQNGKHDENKHKHKSHNTYIYGGTVRQGFVRRRNNNGCLSVLLFLIVFIGWCLYMI